MTVRLNDFAWFPGLKDRLPVPMFQRVTKVYLYGAQYKGNLLPEISKFHDLKELEVYETSIPSRDLDAWRKLHPQVAVSETHKGIAR